MRIQKNDFIIAGTFDNGLDILDLKGHKIKTIDGRSAPFIWWSEQNILVSRASEHTHYACIDQY